MVHPLLLTSPLKYVYIHNLGRLILGFVKLEFEHLLSPFRI